MNAFRPSLRLAGAAVLLVCLTAGTSFAESASVFAADNPQELAENMTQKVQAHLDNAQRVLDKVLAVEGRRTIANTLEPMNQISIEVADASSYAQLMENVHPDADVRTTAEKAAQDVSAFGTELSLNRDVYEALVSVDLSGGDALTRRMVEKSLREYRRSGVDKDEATRERIKALREELVEIGQEFGRNIREARRYIYLDSVEELAGLPADFIEGHPPGEDGRIAVSTEYPDYLPVMTYAENADLRRRLYHEYNNRAYPENQEVLQRLLTRRHELAHLLGYDNWADYITEDKMAGSGASAEEFVKRLDDATRMRAEQDYAMLLARKSKDVPGATEVADWEKSYYSELVKGEEYDFDSQELRAYYNYPQVKQGMLDLTAALFAVTFKPAPNTEVWHETVECFEMYEDGALRGRFYLDMHPRDGKYSHAAQFPLITGIKGVRVPEAALVCNFPEPDENGLALMEHDDVETFLHEFGHLLHTLFGGHHRWADQSGIATEWDFVEAPSQMLQEWALDAGTLQKFARHHETGEPIPAELIDRLRRARDFGTGLYVRQQAFYTAVSLFAHNRPPSGVNMDELVPELQAKYSPYDYVPDTHMYASFGHLNGYSAMYYTYMWSLVIAKDMFSKFDPENLLDSVTATNYRRTVLEPGGTLDAAELVERFLGRPYNFDAFARWLSGAS